MKFLLRGLKSLFWFIARLFGKRPKYKVNELKKKQKAYVWNFSPGRLKNVSFQKKDKQSQRQQKSKKGNKELRTKSVLAKISVKNKYE